MENKKNNLTKSLLLVGLTFISSNALYSLDENQFKNLLYKGLKTSWFCTKLLVMSYCIKETGTKGPGLSTFAAWWAGRECINDWQSFTNYLNAPPEITKVHQYEYFHNTPERIYPSTNPPPYPGQ